MDVVLTREVLRGKGVNRVRIPQGSTIRGADTDGNTLFLLVEQKVRGTGVRAHAIRETNILVAAEGVPFDVERYKFVNTVRLATVRGVEFLTVYKET